MAQTLAFVRGAVTRSLLEPGTGMALRPGWAAKIALPSYGKDPPDIVEDMPIWIEDTSDDTLAGELQEFHQMQHWAARYMVDRTETTPVWLENQTIHETNKRRALVKRIVGDFSTGEHDSNMASHHLEIPMEVVRAPYWERTAAISLTEAYPAAAAAVVYDYTAGAGDVVGDVPARVLLVVREATATSWLDRLWMGIRSADKHGATGISNFVHIWEWENGTAMTDAIITTDGTASPGGGGNTKILVTPGTTTWARRAYILLSDISANEADQYGKYQWLLRAKVDSGDTWEVKLRFTPGLHPTEEIQYVEGPTVEITNASWDYTAQGIFPIPIRDLRAIPTADFADSFDQDFCIVLWARRTAGTGSLHLDCLVPMPIDEGFLWVDGGGASGLSGNGVDYMVIGEAPEGAMHVAGHQGTEFKYFPEFGNEMFRFPPGDGRLIVVYARPGSSLLTDRVYIGSSPSKIYPRWCSLRGNE